MDFTVENRDLTCFSSDFSEDICFMEVRGFDKAINIWGADHHGHVARLKGAMDALGLDGEHRLDVVLMQLVKLMRDGVPVKMSKRTGKAISLHDLLDEVPVDAARYFFNSRPESPVEFDLDLAVRQDSENPVYYVQYAHARICTLIAALAELGRHRQRQDPVLLLDPLLRSRPREHPGVLHAGGAHGGGPVLVAGRGRRPRLQVL